MTVLWRSFTTPLTELALPKHAYQKISDLLDFLQTEQDKLSRDPTYMAACETYKSEIQGDFWNKVNRATHKPHHTWPEELGERAKYYRMLQERLRVTLDSLHERQAIARTCQTHGWDSKKLKEIREELADQGLYPSWKHLENILAAKSIPITPGSIPAFLDYTVGDKQIIKQDGLSYSVKVGKEWFMLEIPEPKHLRERTGKYSKPIIQRTKDGDLVVRVAYEAKVTTSPILDKNTSMGVDLGLKKPFAAAVAYGDQSFTTELTYSKETARLAEKITRLQAQQDACYGKLAAYQSLLVGREDAYLVQHFLAVEEYLKKVRAKKSSLKLQVGRLVARDIIAHAVACGVGIIKLEDLKFVTGKGGSWDYARTQIFIREAAELAGITVVTVDANNSSHSDPFTGAFVTPKKDRTVLLACGVVWDRDFVAGLELACRPEAEASVRKRSKSNKKKQVSVAPTRVKLAVGKCRDKSCPTPKRPKLSGRKQKCLLKNRLSTGAFVVVASSGKARVESHLSGVSPANAVGSEIITGCNNPSLT